jgi:NAD(P)-dependent dehydrogenase (short-subunit alcohol dehydrogenase family)
VIDVNLMGAMRISRAAARPMLSARRGSIVHVASLTAHAALPGRLAYTCSKHGVLGLVRTLATEWAPWGVRVNAVTPGWVGTDMTAGGLASGRLDGSLIERQTPAGRWATPEDVAGAAAFLLGAGANFVNGAEIVVDGGWSAAVRAEPMASQLPLGGSPVGSRRTSAGTGG